MNNIWKQMEVGKVYDALASMSPEERLKDLYKTQKELTHLLSGKEELKAKIFSYIDNYLDNLKPEYEDYSFPHQAMMSEADDIIHDMVGEEEFYNLIKAYMKETI